MGKDRGRMLYGLVQWTWGLPQNLLGGLLTLLYRKREHFCYRTTYVTRWPRSGSMSLGMFLFLGKTAASLPEDARNAFEARILVHEYGHTIQSLILGPLYLPVIGLPSLLWACVPFFLRLRSRKHISYFSMYQEKWANHLGARVTKLPPPEQNS